MVYVWNGDRNHGSNRHALGPGIGVEPGNSLLVRQPHRPGGHGHLDPPRQRRSTHHGDGL